MSTIYFQVVLQNKSHIDINIHAVGKCDKSSRSINGRSLYYFFK